MQYSLERRRKGEFFLKLFTFFYTQNMATHQAAAFGSDCKPSADNEEILSQETVTRTIVRTKLQQLNFIVKCKMLDQHSPLLSDLKTLRFMYESKKNENPYLGVYCVIE